MAVENAREKNDENYKYVRSTTGDNRVALAEVDPKHPGGSVMVAGPGTFKVGNTAFVQAQIRSRTLAEVKDAAERKKADAVAEERINANREVLPRPEVPAAEDVDEETGEVKK